MQVSTQLYRSIEDTVERARKASWRRGCLIKCMEMVVCEADTVEEEGPRGQIRQPSRLSQTTASSIEERPCRGR